MLTLQIHGASGRANLGQFSTVDEATLAVRAMRTTGEGLMVLTSDNGGAWRFAAGRFEPDTNWPAVVPHMRVVTSEDGE